MASKEKRKEIYKRRAEVARLLAEKVPKQEIAKRLGVSPATITQDDKAILEECRRQFSESAADLKAQQLRDLDLLLAEAWKILNKSKEDQEVHKERTGDVDSNNYTEDQKIGRDGNPVLLARILDILKERAELMGIKEIVNIPESLELIIREPTDKEVERDTKGEKENRGEKR